MKTREQKLREALELLVKAVESLSLVVYGDRERLFKAVTLAQETLDTTKLPTFEQWYAIRFPEGFAVDKIYLQEAFEAGRSSTR